MNIKVKKVVFCDKVNKKFGYMNGFGIEFFMGQEKKIIGTTSDCENINESIDSEQLAIMLEMVAAELRRIGKES